MIADVIILLGLLLLEPILATYRYAVRKAFSHIGTVTLTMGASFLYGLAIAVLVWAMSGVVIETSFQGLLLGGVILGSAFAIICAYVFLIKALRKHTDLEGSDS